MNTRKQHLAVYGCAVFLFAAWAANLQGQHLTDATKTGGLFSGWDGSFDLGLNGATGNSDFFNLGSGVNATRTTDSNEIDFALAYFFSHANSSTSIDRLYSTLRNVRPIPDSLLSWYTSAWFERDRFRDFDFRLALHTGLVLDVLSSDTVKCDVLAGIGASRAFGGNPDEWLPEVQLGLDFERQITERQKCFLIANYFPDLNSPSDFRATVQAGWLVLVDPEHNLSLKASIFDRYATTNAPGTKPNDLDYLLGLSWAF